MTESKENQSEASHDLFTNHLKSIEAKELERSIAEAVTTLVGADHRCTISTIDYDDSVFAQGARIELTVSKIRQTHDPI